MGNLIFLIIIIIVLRNAIEKAKSDPGRRNGQRSGLRSGDGNRTRAEGQAVKQNPSAASSKAGSRVSRHTASGSGSRAAAQKSAVVSAAQEAEQISTTEYLRQKALEDQKEHEEAARLEAMRLHRETGGRSAAQRHYDGDSVPRGMRIVKCGYCGAENLIGDYQNQKDFTCYFCREIL